MVTACHACQANFVMRVKIVVSMVTIGLCGHDFSVFMIVVSVGKLIAIVVTF